MKPNPTPQDRPKLIVWTNPSWRRSKKSTQVKEPGWGRIVGHEGMIRQAGAR